MRKALSGSAFPRTPFPWKLIVQQEAWTFTSAKTASEATSRKEKVPMGGEMQKNKVIVVFITLITTRPKEVCHTRIPSRRLPRFEK